MAKKMEKYIWLVDTLRRSGGLTLEEVDRAWQRSSLCDGEAFTKRSFHRYRREIEDRFGLRVLCDRHDFTYHIEEETPLQDGGVQTWLLDTLAVDNLLTESRDLRDRILFENIPSGQHHLARILGAMRDGIVLEMQYARFSGEEPYTTWLQPYFVKVFAQRWYVIGPTGRHPEAPHVYALDRVTSLRETPERFVYPPDFDPAAFFADNYGIFHSSEAAQRIVLRAGERQAKFLRSLPLHASQRELTASEVAALGLGLGLDGVSGTDAVASKAGTDSGIGSAAGASEVGAYFVLRLVPTLDFIQYLLSQGDDLEVLAPASLRADLCRRASAVAALYR